MGVFFIGWITLALVGQELPQARVGALMETSVEKQLSAVRKQTALPAGTFFVVPAFLLPPPQSLGATLLAAADSDCAALGDPELTPLATEAAQAAGVKPEWLLALVAEKSQGRPCALSPAGAAGLMQLAPATIDEWHVADPFDPRQNLAAGARLLAQLVARYQGDFARARAAYDGAPTAGAPAPASPPAATHGSTSPAPALNQPSPADKNK